MENLLLPSKVEFQEETSTQGKLIITPCYFGYGTTLGNTLRRVLLSSLPGVAVEAFKIKGVQHEFSAIDGVKEDVVQIILNLKQLAVKLFVNESVTLKISKKGVGPVTAGDIEPNSNAEIHNKDLVLATLTSSKQFEMDIVVGHGRAFKPAEEKDKSAYDLGTIVIDSIYNPIKDIGYNVEYTRVGDITNYEKLTVNIETNGTISPREAVRQTTQIIMDHFNMILTAASEGWSAIQELSPEAEIKNIPEDALVEEEDIGEKKEKKTKTKKAKK
jgi:DNA-directed RNA polymerase subunit alpha